MNKPRKLADAAAGQPGHRSVIPRSAAAPPRSLWSGLKWGLGVLLLLIAIVAGIWSQRDPIAIDLMELQPRTQPFFSRQIEQNLRSFNRQLIAARNMSEAVALYDHMIFELDQERRLLQQFEPKTEPVRNVKMNLSNFLDQYYTHATVARQALIDGDTATLENALLQMDAALRILPSSLREAMKLAAQHGVAL